MKRPNKYVEMNEKKEILKIIIWLKQNLAVTGFVSYFNSRSSKYSFFNIINIKNKIQINRIHWKLNFDGFTRWLRLEGHFK